MVHENPLRKEHRPDPLNDSAASAALTHVEGQRLSRQGSPVAEPVQEPGSSVAAIDALHADEQVTTTRRTRFTGPVDREGKRDTALMKTTMTNALSALTAPTTAAVHDSLTAAAQVSSDGRKAFFSGSVTAHGQRDTALSCHQQALAQGAGTALPRMGVLVS